MSNLVTSLRHLIKNKKREKRKKNGEKKRIPRHVHGLKLDSDGLLFFFLSPTYFVVPLVLPPAPMCPLSHSQDGYGIS